MVLIDQIRIWTYPTLSFTAILFDAKLNNEYHSYNEKNFKKKKQKKKRNKNKNEIKKIRQSEQISIIYAYN